MSNQKQNDLYDVTSPEDILSLEELQDKFADKCSECGAIIVDGAVEVCLGDTGSCQSYSYHDEFLDDPVEFGDDYDPDLVAIFDPEEEDEDEEEEPYQGNTTTS